MIQTATKLNSRMHLVIYICKAKAIIGMTKSREDTHVLQAPAPTQFRWTNNIDIVESSAWGQIPTIVGTASKIEVVVGAATRETMAHLCLWPILQYTSEYKMQLRESFECCV